MTWGAALVKFLAGLVRALPLFAVWIANRMGKKAGRAEAEAEQTAVNAQAQEKYAEIETEDRSEGDWIK